MEEHQSVLCGFLAGFLLIGVLGWHGCSESTRATVSETAGNVAIKAQNAAVKTECLKQGHPVLECEKLP